MFWINSVPLFHLRRSAFSSLFVKIKFTLTFPPIFILLMCVSMRGSLCACALYTITSVHVYEYLWACAQKTINSPVLEECTGLSDIIINVAPGPSLQLAKKLPFCKVHHRVS